MVTSCKSSKSVAPPVALLFIVICFAPVSTPKVTFEPGVSINVSVALAATILLPSAAMVAKLFDAAPPPLAAIVTTPFDTCTLAPHEP